ncbi:hypothetical protein T4B_6044, partial [Trichinella pseudospiralis]
TLHENNKKLKLAQSTHSPLPFRSKPVDLMRSCIVSDVCSTTHARGRNIVAKGMEWFEPLGIRTEDVNNIISGIVSLVRTCGDYKALRKHAYPVPTVIHLLTFLAGDRDFA